MSEISATPYFVSIVMPILNESHFIRKSLHMLLKQDYPLSSVEILVVDGMSEDNTRDIIREMMAENPDVKLQIIDNPGRTRPKALNVGILHAKGEVVIFVDGHCEIAPDYISQCVKHLWQREDVAVVGGPIETIGQGATGETIAVAMSTPFGVGGATFRTVQDREMIVDTVAFGAYRRHILDNVGTFDERMVTTEDDEYNYRLRSLGHQILMSPEIHSRYYCRNTLRALWKQYYRYGFYKVGVFKKHPRQMRFRHFVPPLFVAALFAGAVLSPFSKAIRTLWAFLLVLYCIVNLCISLYTALKRGYKHLWMLPAVFATLHISYGVGFVMGIINMLWSPNNKTE